MCVDILNIKSDEQKVFAFHQGFLSDVLCNCFDMSQENSFHLCSLCSCHSQLKQVFQCTNKEKEKLKKIAVQLLSVLFISFDP